MSSAMTTARLSLDATRIFAVCSLTMVVAVLAACRGEGQQAGPGGPGGGGPPPMPVEVLTLSAKPVEQSTEYVASLKSRRSSTIQPEVEASLMSIAVRSGQQVAKGTLLFEIDSAPQQAALGSLQSMRPSRESDVEFARQQVSRNRTLLQAGAISQREVEQFEAQLRSAEAQLQVLDEQIKQQ